MVMHICNNCDYRFDGENPSECPSCGGKNIKKEKNAEDFLEEINHILKNG
jgi:rRNA maturation endonuclease Nob1